MLLGSFLEVKSQCYIFRLIQDWGCGLRGTAAALQVWGLEF
jgi:hypothetical protein